MVLTQPPANYTVAARHISPSKKCQKFNTFQQESDFKDYSICWSEMKSEMYLEIPKTE